MEKKAQRQLKELRRLMPWNWDSRVEEHPPGEKAMHDFEDIVNYRIDGRKRRSHSIVKEGKEEPAAGGGDAKTNEGESPVGQLEEGVSSGGTGVDAVERADDDKENMIPSDGVEEVEIEMKGAIEAEKVTAAVRAGGERTGEDEEHHDASMKINALSSALAAVQAANDRVAQMKSAIGSNKNEDIVSKEKVVGSPVACESKVAGGLVEVQTPGVCWSGKEEEGKKKKRAHDACVTPAVAIVDSQFVLTPGSSSASRKPISLAKDAVNEDTIRNNNKRTQLPDSVIGTRRGKRGKQENVIVEPLMQTAAETAKPSPETKNTDSIQEVRNVTFSAETKRRDGRKKDGILMLDDDVQINLDKYGDGPQVMRPSDCPPLFSSGKITFGSTPKHVLMPHDAWYKDLQSPGDDVVQPRDATPFKGRGTAAFFDKEKVITEIIQEGINMRSQSLNVPSLPPVEPLQTTSKLSVLGSRLSWALGQLASQS